VNNGEGGSANERDTETRHGPFRRQRLPHDAAIDPDREDTDKAIQDADAGNPQQEPGNKNFMMSSFHLLFEGLGAEQQEAQQQPASPATVATAYTPMPAAWASPALTPARAEPRSVWRVTTARLAPGVMAPSAHTPIKSSQSVTASMMSSSVPGVW
jgi:hypothetical protein